MKSITATQINIYHICHRELWLHTHNIQMEHTSDTVYEGKLIGEHTYTQRADKYTELVFDGVKIDFYDAKNKIVHEVKKSDRLAEAYRAQVKYYIWILEKNGIEGATGILEYPKQRATEQVSLSDKDRTDIVQWITDINTIIAADKCPQVINKPLCKQCSYYELCYANE